MDGPHLIDSTGSTLLSTHRTDEFMHPVFTILSRPKVVVITGVVYLLGQIGMTRIVRDIGPELFQLQVTTDWTRFQDIQSHWSETQWAQYHAHFAVDFIFPWTYGLFLTCWLLRHAAHFKRSVRWTIWIPLSTSIADCIENAIHLTLLNASDNAIFWVMVSGLISRYKWSIAALLSAPQS